MYVSLDIETTGLEPGKHSVIELGAVIDDFESPIDELPTFRCLIDNDTIVADSYALGMHADSGLLKELQDPEDDVKVLDPEIVGLAFKRWMIRHDVPNYSPDKTKEFRVVRPVAAGKNVASFDIPHLETFPDFTDHVKFHHRVLDPGSMYFDPEKEKVPPNLSTCLERAGFDDEIAHTGVEDSIDVIRLIRHAKGVDLS
mgnify:CR=1 FL=1